MINSDLIAIWGLPSIDYLLNSKTMFQTNVVFKDTDHQVKWL